MPDPIPPPDAAPQAPGSGRGAIRSGGSPAAGSGDFEPPAPDPTTPAATTAAPTWPAGGPGGVPAPRTEGGGTAAAGRRGVLLVNLGTPDEPTPRAVRRYLAEFLSDPYVIDIPAPLRFLLLHGIILPTRPRRAAAAYRKVWTERGSPLLFHCQDLVRRLRPLLGRPVALGMRYGNPSLGSALDELAAAGVDGVQVLPLFPQYSESAWETAAAATRTLAGLRDLAVELVPPFFADAGFLDAVAAECRKVFEGFGPDHVLFSFHGLPERHVRRTDRSGGKHCLTAADCCGTLGDANRDCYRAQCFATARGVAKRLELRDPDIAFQSRLGRTPWIRPFTDERIVELARSGCKRLAVACPSFVADCLETLEEIQIRARDSFREHGGADLRLVPAPNSSDTFVAAIARLLDGGPPGGGD